MEPVEKVEPCLCHNLVGRDSDQKGLIGRIGAHIEIFVHLEIPEGEPFLELAIRKRGRRKRFRLRPGRVQKRTGQGQKKKNGSHLESLQEEWICHGTFPKVWGGGEIFGPEDQKMPFSARP